MTRKGLREEWRLRLADFDGSGLTQREWCAEKGVALHQFAYWRRQLKEADGGQPASGEWCQVSLLPVGTPQAVGLTVRVGPAAIEVSPGFDPSLLQAIVQTLAEVRL